MQSGGYGSLPLDQKYLFWDKNPLLGIYEITVPGCSRFRMYSKNDDTVIKELHWTGYTGWELCSLLLWSHYCRAINGGLILDIGTYTGFYSLLAASENSETSIYAFDIQSRCIERLSTNIVINSFNNILPKLLAPGSENGHVEFYTSYEPKIIRSVASLTPNEFCNVKSSVDSIKLDDFLKESIDRVSLVKIDVEGAEKSVLGGMQNILSRSIPDVLCEINNAGDAWNIKQKYFPEEYFMYTIDDERLKLAEVNSSDFNKVGRNYLFTTRLPQLDWTSMMF